MMPPLHLRSARQLEPKSNIMVLLTNHQSFQGIMDQTVGKDLFYYVMAIADNK